MSRTKLLVVLCVAIAGSAGAAEETTRERPEVPPRLVTVLAYLKALAKETLVIVSPQVAAPVEGAGGGEQFSPRKE